MKLFRDGSNEINRFSYQDSACGLIQDNSVWQHFGNSIGKRNRRYFLWLSALARLWFWNDGWFRFWKPRNPGCLFRRWFHNRFRSFRRRTTFRARFSFFYGDNKMIFVICRYSDTGITDTLLRNYRCSYENLKNYQKKTYPSHLAKIVCAFLSRYF